MCKKKKGCLIITVIVILICVIIAGYFVYLDHWFDRMQEQLPIAKQKYLDNYHEILEQIPAPEGVQEKDRNEEGILTNYQYGIYTIIDYINPETVDIKKYYYELLTYRGWMIRNSDQLNSEYQYYVKGESCITIIGFDNNPYNYEMYIFQDFSSQDFAPDMPPSWYVQLRHYGEAMYVTCQ
jgi:hypothetical protein